jgi:D-glycero-D-manno-heptose 1,7-bisphosphate phosphatase
MKRAVFLDRDGTIIQEKEYLSRPEDVRILPGAAEALQRLRNASFALFIVSNQSGVGRGYFTLADVERVHRRMIELLSGVQFEKIYVAPETPQAPSHGRKPSPQFLFEGRDEFGIELPRSYMVGDKLIDLECGWNAGVRKSILVRTGYGAGTERDQPAVVQRAWVVNDLMEATQMILKD